MPSKRVAQLGPFLGHVLPPNRFFLIKRTRHRSSVSPLKPGEMLKGD